MTTTAMTHDDFDLDDLKRTWKHLDRELHRQNALQFALLQERKVGRIRSRLRPLLFGQTMQMLLGLCMILLGVDVWARHHDTLHLLLAGIAVHAYGVGAIIAAGIVCGGIARIDHSAPVLELQRRLLKLRRAYLISGMCVGLPWWVFWAPFVMTLAMWATGIDIYAAAMTSAPVANWIHINLAVGVLGLFGTWVFHRWSRHPSRAALGEALDAAAAGGSLRRAQAELDALRAYAEE